MFSQVSHIEHLDRSESYAVALLTMSLKTTCLAMIPCALLFSAPSSAQPPNADRRDETSLSADEELVVRGRRPAEFRAALEAARVRVYDVFNALNSDDAFDVHCRREASTGRRIKQHVCRAQFKDDISNAAARAFVNGIKDLCSAHSMQDCIFGDNDAIAAQGISRAQAEESREGPMQKLFVSEFSRVLLENPELQEAILDYQALEQAYRESRRARR